jgi:acyl-coenzyme A thioesterase PaaI-like protein
MKSARELSDFVPSDPAFQARIQASFAKQGLMTSLGASLVHVAPGMVEIALPASPAVSQQHGFVHAGALAAIADTAAGYAALKGLRVPARSAGREPERECFTSFTFSP